MNLEGLGLCAFVLLSSSRSLVRLKEGSMLAGALQCARVILVISPCSKNSKSNRCDQLMGSEKGAIAAGMTLRSDLLEMLVFFFKISHFLPVLLLTREPIEGGCSCQDSLLASLALHSLLPRSPCGVSDSDKYLYKS